jgi:Zn-dependent M32 family carboxypeptidase
MNLLKKILLASSIALSMTMVSSSAFAAGKVEKATTAAVVVAIDNVISLTKKTLVAVESCLQGDASTSTKETKKELSKQALKLLKKCAPKEDAQRCETESAVLALIKETKQASKQIESNVVDRLRSKANSKMVKARSAIKKCNDYSIAQPLVDHAINIYKKVKAKHAKFNGLPS